MKKVIIMLVVLLSVNSYAASKGFSHKPYLDASFNNYMVGNTFVNMWFLNLEVGYKFKWNFLTVKIFGSIDSYWYTENKLNVYPFRNIYTVGGRIYVKNLYIQVKYQYSHEVFTTNGPVDCSVSHFYYPVVLEGEKLVASIGIKL